MAAHEEDDKLNLHMAINMTAKLEKELQDTKDEVLLGFPSLVKGEP